MAIKALTSTIRGSDQKKKVNKCLLNDTRRRATGQLFPLFGSNRGKAASEINSALQHFKIPLQKKAKGNVYRKSNHVNVAVKLVPETAGPKFRRTQVLRSGRMRDNEKC
ncbi:hypothetical protein CDAR_404911 [Caerostris darwini]|uniref:Uncharacterized protein n=1 Tax=Caerostris darwini TaxID=1538125 RepID=A0AAV4U735_9ARAC|nr:hypothetical protein CDAR_404911 [Caerostris darwini]